MNDNHRKRRPFTGRRMRPRLRRTPNRVFSLKTGRLRICQRTGRLRIAGPALASVVVVLGAAAFAFLPCCGERPATPRLPDSTSTDTDSTTTTIARGGKLAQDELLSQLLTRLGVEERQTEMIQTALAETDFDFRNLHPGDSVTLFYHDPVGGPAGSASTLVSIRYHLDLAVGYEVVLTTDTAVAGLFESKVDTVAATLAGVVHGSLWESLTIAGADPQLVVYYTEVLRRNVDFLGDVGPGDTFGLLVEKLYVDTVFYRFGDITAARYRNAASDNWAFLYRTEGHGGFYCDEDGRSLWEALVYPPVVGGRRTSDFGLRMHPIRRRRIRHNGLDYAAAHGSPVRAIADGTVAVRRWSGGYGRMVAVTHDDGVTVSRYGHLSKYGPGIRQGSRVRQGQTVGYVGSTGLSTGFHLDFELRSNDKPVDPVQALPSRFEQVPSEDMVGFRKQVKARRDLIGRALSGR